MTLAALPPIPPLLSICSSWNLQLDKFSFRRNGEAEAKTDVLKAVIKTYERGKGQLDKAIKARQDWLKRLEAQHGTARLRKVRLYSTSPLILHLGRANVLENVGLYCERTTGLPVIPGTAVKGVLSTWACWEANQNEDGSFPDPESWTIHRSAFPVDHARRIFGSDDETGSESAGEISFLGAWPATLPKLVLDIVNPHHDATGRDLTRLTPSVFLSLESGPAWDFVFLVRPGVGDGIELLNTTETWLCESLSQIGLGAKTAAGYGRFVDTVQVVPNGPKPVQPAPPIPDFNDAIFKNTVLDVLGSPALLPQLERQIANLQKPENAPWLDKLKQQLLGKSAKDLRKRLKDKTWFPQEWLPSQP